MSEDDKIVELYNTHNKKARASIKRREEIKNILGEAKLKNKFGQNKNKIIYLMIAVAAMAIVIAILFFVYQPNNLFPSTQTIVTGNKNNFISNVENLEILNEKKPKNLRFWNNLSIDERKEIKAKSLILFPEIFGKKYRTKYKRVSIWVGETLGINQKDTRSIYSSGGKADIIVNGQTYERVKRVVVNFWKLSQLAKAQLLEANERELAQYWGNFPPDSKKARIEFWSAKAGEDLNGIDKQAFDAIIQSWLAELQD